MASFKRFGTIAIFLTYLLFQFNNIYAQGFVESKKEELADIYKHLEVDVPESEQQLTIISKGEELAMGEKKKDSFITRLNRIKEVHLETYRRFKNMIWGKPEPPKSKVGDFIKENKANIQYIFPGTLWCGEGNIAHNETELGTHNLTDACCRAHDNCPLNIEKGKSFGPLKNNGYFTRSWCACDDDFFQCLSESGASLFSPSRKIGTLYFGILAPQCIDYNYPAKCNKLSSITDFAGRRCVDYKYDKSQEKILQWRDSPHFTGLTNLILSG